MTARHQGNLKRFLRELHRDNEINERDKQRAKDEVARLNGAKPTSVASFGTGPKATAINTSALRNATPEEMKRQMAQLAEMGVFVPEEFRKENAMAGDWEVVARRVISSAPKVEDQKETAGDNKAAVSVGVRKRKPDGEEEEEQQPTERKRRNWGSDVKIARGDDQDLDALLESTTAVAPLPIKKEESLDAREHQAEAIPITSGTAPSQATVKEEAAPSDVDSMFKKRKSRAKG